MATVDMTKNWMTKCLLIAFSLSLAWISIILYYTRGRLLIGGDWPGEYDAFTSMRTGIPSMLIRGVSLLFAGGDIYVGFYLAILLGVFLNLLSLIFFTTTLFEDWKGKVIPAVLPCTFYVFGMFCLYNSFKSVIGIADVVVAGLLLFLAHAVKYYRYVLGSYRFTRFDCGVMGFAVAVMSRFPPNSFRFLVLASIIMMTLLALALIPKNVKRVLVIRRFVMFLPLIALVAFLVMLPWEIPFFFSLGKNVVTASYATQAHLRYFLARDSFASLANTFRVLGSWVFTTEYVPYHALYFEDPLIVLTSFMWPIMSLGVAPLLTMKNRQKGIVLSVLGSLAIILWDSGTNTPIGSLMSNMPSYFLVFNALFPTYFLSSTLLPVLYVSLSSFAILRIIELAKRRHPKTKQRKTGLFLALTLVGMLLVPARPFFTGEALGQYFNPDIKGLKIPAEYSQVKDRLVESKPNGTVLLFPSMDTYVQTSWGYQGTNSFYNSYFAPINVLTPDAVGGAYQEYVPESFLLYKRLAIPELKPTVIHYLPANTINIKGVSVHGSKWFINGSNVVVYDPDSNEGYPWIDIVFPFSISLNELDCHCVLVKTNMSTTTDFPTILSSSGFWVGMTATKGWYLLSGSSSGAEFKRNTLVITISTCNPDKTFLDPAWDPLEVDGIIFRIMKNSVSRDFRITLSAPIIGMSSDEMWDENYVGILKEYHVKYVLIDRSILEGHLIELKYYERTMNTMNQQGLTSLVFNGEYLELYEINSRYS